jgi:hypothetical protein
VVTPVVVGIEASDICESLPSLSLHLPLNLVLLQFIDSKPQYNVFLGRRRVAESSCASQLAAGSHNSNTNTNTNTNTHVSWQGGANINKNLSHYVFLGSEKRQSLGKMKSTRRQRSMF